MRIDAQHRLADLVPPRRRQALSGGGSIQADRIEPVMPHLYADGALCVALEKVSQSPGGDATAGGEPPLGLLELIAVVRIVEEVGEVREEIQAVVPMRCRMFGGGAFSMTFSLDSWRHSDQGQNTRYLIVTGLTP